MGSNSRLSAAIYDTKAQPVRHLYELAPRTGKLTVPWDGKDDHGAHADQNTHYRIFRLDARTGKAADWSGNPGGPSILAANWTPGTMPITGLAVDGTYLWVSDAAENRVEVFTKADGKPAPILGGEN